VHALNGSGVNQPITAYGVCATTPGRQVVPVTVNVPSGVTATINAACPAGTVNTGGGFFHGSNTNVRIKATRPAPAGQVWEVQVVNSTTVAQPVTSYSVCATGT